MIRNVVIHLDGKLPLVADLRQLPAATDQAVVCTNVRTRDGKRPSFIDDGRAWFLIPLHQITIVELPAASIQGAEADERDAAWQVDANGVTSRGQADAESEMTALEANEELLARIRGL